MQTKQLHFHTSLIYSFFRNNKTKSPQMDMFSHGESNVRTEMERKRKDIEVEEEER